MNDFKRYNCTLLTTLPIHTIKLVNATTDLANLPSSVTTSMNKFENKKFNDYQVSQKFSGPDIPELNRSVVRWGNHELGVELEASDGRLVLIRT